MLFNNGRCIGKFGVVSFWDVRLLYGSEGGVIGLGSLGGMK